MGLFGVSGEITSKDIVQGHSEKIRSNLIAAIKNTGMDFGTFWWYRKFHYKDAGIVLSQYFAWRTNYYIVNWFIIMFLQ